LFGANTEHRPAGVSDVLRATWANWDGARVEFRRQGVESPGALGHGERRGMAAAEGCTQSIVISDSISTVTMKTHQSIKIVHIVQATLDSGEWYDRSLVLSPQAARDLVRKAIKWDKKSFYGRQHGSYRIIERHITDRVLKAYPPPDAGVTTEKTGMNHQTTTSPCQNQAPPPFPSKP
jgi:hypothetical protein